MYILLLWHWKTQGGSRFKVVENLYPGLGVEILYRRDFLYLQYPYTLIVRTFRRIKAEKAFPPSATGAVIREFRSESIRRREISSTADAHLWRRNSVKSIRYRLSNPREHFTPSDVIKVTLVRRGGIRSSLMSENTSWDTWCPLDLDSDQLDFG